jgi:hypothetical protein
MTGVHTLKEGHMVLKFIIPHTEMRLSVQLEELYCILTFIQKLKQCVTKQIFLKNTLLRRISTCFSILSLQTANSHYSPRNINKIIL